MKTTATSKANRLDGRTVQPGRASRFASAPACSLSQVVWVVFNSISAIDDQLAFLSFSPSGTLDGAGGVGGLLATEVGGVWYFPLYDNNGNVTDYVSETGEVVASYTYDAFGRTLSATGSMADVFPFRFSTKYYDAEAGLYYYGYRYYSPDLGRWLTRDPIEEDGGDNLYAFCGNSPLSTFDYLGMAKICDYLRNAALQWSHRRFQLDYERSFQDAIIDSAWRKCYDRIAPKSVMFGVETALSRLNTQGVTVTEGTSLKANVSDNIICNLILSGHSPRKSATISSASAWSVPLKAPWELKIYEGEGNAYQAAVGYTTQSAAHYYDASQYLLSLIGLLHGMPKSYNSEDYVGHIYIDEEASRAFKEYSEFLSFDSLR